MRKKIVFLVSGGGGNLKFVKNCLDTGITNRYELVGVIADRPCRAINYAIENLIPNYLIQYTRHNNEQLIELLVKLNPDFIVTNIHKILDAEVVELFKNKLINLHYSLLPAFKGLIGDEPVRQALALGCEYIGTTVHYVDVEVDSGKIISQSIVQIKQDYDFSDLMNQVFRSGCINLLNAMNKLSGYPLVHEDLFEESFWELIS